MTNFKNIAATFLMIAVMLFGTTFANAGIVIAGALTGPDSTASADGLPCTNKTDDGGIVTSLAGIIIAGFTGVTVADSSDDEVCGIIIAGA